MDVIENAAGLSDDGAKFECYRNQIRRNSRPAGKFQGAEQLHGQLANFYEIFPSQTR